MSVQILSIKHIYDAIIALFMALLTAKWHFRRDE